MRRKRFVVPVLLVSMLLVLTGCDLEKEAEDAGYSNVTLISEDDRVSVVTAEVGKCKVRITQEKTGESRNTHQYTVEYLKSDKETVRLKDPSEALLNKEDAEAILRNKDLCGEKK